MYNVNYLLLSCLSFSAKSLFIFTIRLVVQACSICSVTDSETGVCVDPGEKGAILEAGEPGPPGGGKGWQLAPDSRGEGT
jgi:hypothetical protein